MKFNLAVMLAISGPVFASLQKRADPSGCHANNCLRAIRATSLLPQASVDCSSFLVETVTPQPVTVTATLTFTSLPKRTAAYGPVIPTYASACSNVSAYSSACSCLGITATTTTLTPPSTTITDIYFAAPTLTCAGETCSKGFIPTCNPDNTDCFCFTSANGIGFCGYNNSCDALTPCERDDDCLIAEFSSGHICAVNTCCGGKGVCLEGYCANPSAKLRRMARDVKRSHLEPDTAAFKGH